MCFLLVLTFGVKWQKRQKLIKKFLFSYMISLSEKKMWHIRILIMKGILQSKDRGFSPFPLAIIIG